MSRVDRDPLDDDLPDPFADELARPLPPLPALARDPAPTRASVVRARWLAAALALAYQVAALVMLGARRDLDTAPRAALAVLVVSPLVAAGVSLRAAARERAGATAPVPVLSAVAVAGAVFAMGAVAAELSSHAPHAPSVWPCVLATLALAAGPLAIGAFTFRGAFASGAPWRMAAVGVAAGALAASTLALECGAGGLGHLLVGHGAGMLAGGLAGLVVARVARA